MLLARTNIASGAAMSRHANTDKWKAATARQFDSIAERWRSRGIVDDERLGSPDGAFDALICFNVLDFTPRPGVALTEFRRVLKPGGRLVLIMLGAYSPVKLEWWRRFLPDHDGKHTGNDILP